MISGEGLARTPREVLGTLLHEAAHALADARGITDTSRQGRYHNKKYALLADRARPGRRRNPRFGWTAHHRPRRHRPPLRRPSSPCSTPP